MMKRTRLNISYLAENERKVINKMINEGIKRLCEERENDRYVMMSCL